MTDNSADSLLTQRKVADNDSEKVTTEIKDDTATSSEIAEENKKKLTTWESIKYYYRRFRYYHFVVVETLDLYASAACLWLINLYLRLFMGVGQQTPSALAEE